MENQLMNKLNIQLANWNVINTKLQNYHWFVTGPDFFTLHAKFEEFYTEAQGNIDEIAERILAIGGKPVATLRGYLELTTLNEAGNELQAKDMVSDLVRDYESLVKGSKELIELAEEANDHPTADMFTDIQTSLEQHIWMLQAYLR
ncbi:Dps family protein [Heyndrickxia sp. FSL K6-6286]|uniref:Dps family protein n=1 Tax=Heyndrickxia TaxID=2837504 RepID=UPI0003AA0B92|nr:Dps family protein [Heyndrickxia oleronia]MBU5212218.1 DNA starvation/stationary phase protection protein [Heyndrickxia oleronia]NYV66836.1 DNA starvation/stationary phase protection protein [Bacillus sp. Gen3]OJH16759.1 DNA starvation/stationary phase protection protein [Bacillus obstructivus]GIN41620.1 DNA starvation/stationary phase protection protein [Heyndrickxia oleronia]